MHLKLLDLLVWSREGGKAICICIVRISLAKPHPRTHSARVWLHAYTRFCTSCRISCSSNQITEQVIIAFHRLRHVAATPRPRSTRYTDTNGSTSREAASSAAKELGYPDLKLEQMEVVETFVKGRDVFAILPTGYGKFVFRLPAYCI